MANTNSQSSALWVEKALASLLSSPHISIPHLPGTFMGPGPVDLFSTRFNSTFTSDAKGTVDGKHLDRAGLKETLLALQGHYDPDTVKFRICDQKQHKQPEEVDVSFTWTSKKDSNAQEEVSTSAVVVSQDGSDRISVLNLKGNSRLFQSDAKPQAGQ